MRSPRPERASRRADPDLTLAGDEAGSPDLSELEAGLEISRASSDLLEQPRLFYKAALRAARLQARLDWEERQLALTEARVADTIRESYRSRDDRPTDAQLAARVRVHGDVERDRQRAGSTRREHALAAALVAAYEQRLEALLVLARRER